MGRQKKSNKMGRPINIVDYNPGWADLFEQEKLRLLDIFGDLLVSIHHIGSTAIKTTKAKPEIDILIVIKDDSRLSDYDSDMIKLGYRVRGECLDAGGTPGRFYYDKKQEGVKTHKVHIVKAGHYDIADKLLFVRYLNENPDAGRQYAELKIRLSEKYDYGDIAEYLTEKGVFIKKIIGDAKVRYKDDPIMGGKVECIPRSKKLNTKRCYLRARELKDNAFVFSATRVKGFNDGMLWDPPKTEEELAPKYHESVKKWNDGAGYIFTICENQTHQRIGMIAITRMESENSWSVGYWTHPSFQSRGFMSESVGAILAFGFKDLGATRIEAHFAAWNKASEIVLARNNMKFVEYQPQGFKKNGQWIPANKMAVSKEAWENGECGF